MWLRLQSPFVRCVVVALAIAGLSESILCAPLHALGHHHDETRCDSSDVTEDCHQHDDSCEEFDVPCPCPEGHDCDHCESHHHVAIRSDRSVKGVELIVTAPVQVALPITKPSDASPRRIGSCDPPDQLLRSIQATVLLI